MSPRSRGSLAPAACLLVLSCGDVTAEPGDPPSAGAAGDVEQELICCDGGDGPMARDDPKVNEAPSCLCAPADCVVDNTTVIERWTCLNIICPCRVQDCPDTEGMPDVCYE